MEGSWVGIATATEGVLLGGVKRAVSSRFATEEAAKRWLSVVMKANAECGRPCKGKVFNSQKAPEIDA